jgi:threonyl-tRNA synthetase
MANNMETIRHSTAHLMAAAVLELYPQVKFGIGPIIENGFYYDFELDKKLTPLDLQKIEKKMRELVQKNLKFERKEITIDEAKELFKKLNQPYKLELLEDIKEHGTTVKNELTNSQTSKLVNSSMVTIYELGKFVDLCRGPHLETTKGIGAFKLQKIAGAYWRGDEKNKMLTRIYGLAFGTEKELNEHLKFLEEAEKRDHRELGKSLDLFSISEQLGAGLALWHPKGAMIRKKIEDFWKDEHQKKGYQLVYSPHIGKLNLWKKSGHWDFYRDNLYAPIKIDEEEYLLKPMNCPFHIMIYQSQLRSYRDLPLRYAELGTVYRYERSGVLHGLTRVRGFTQDDAHLFCRQDQIEKEVIGVLKLAIFMMKTFGFKDYQVFLSTRPEKSIGSDKMWDEATSALKKALEKTKVKYEIDKGEGVFYGPKIDIKTIDALGRAWQGPTIQVDFNFPERFDVNYIDEHGKKVRPVMIHRTVLGSMERFFGVLIEHYKGIFPVWLAPIQIYIAPVGKDHWKYCQRLAAELENFDLKVWFDDSRETIGYKIRKAENQKIPYILVIGDKEIKSKKLNVRLHGGKVKQMSQKKFIEMILKEIKNKK